MCRSRLETATTAHPAAVAAMAALPRLQREQLGCAQARGSYCSSLISMAC